MSGGLDTDLARRYVGWAPVPAQLTAWLRDRRAREGRPHEWVRRHGRAPHASQVAIVDDAGVQQRNRSLANDPAKLMPILGGLPPGTPVAFKATYRWGRLLRTPILAH